MIKMFKKISCNGYVKRHVNIPTGMLTFGDFLDRKFNLYPGVFISPVKTWAISLHTKSGYASIGKITTGETYMQPIN
jgi:hypothetical protein